MIVTIHQPEHLVWLGLLDKINRSDVYVILDSVQFEKNNYQNRNRIRTKEGWTWLTIPIKKHPLNTKIKDIEISYTVDWTTRYLDILKLHYKKSPYFTEYFDIISSIILKKPQFLLELNLEILSCMLKSFEITGKTIVQASKMNLGEARGGSDVVLQISKVLNADTYLSGPSGKDYIHQDDFKAAHINLEFHEFHHPTYPQINEPFLPYMASIDALFNIGSDAKNLIYQK